MPCNSSPYLHWKIPIRNKRLRIPLLSLSSLNSIGLWNDWVNTTLCSKSCGSSGNLLQERSYIGNTAIVQQTEDFSSFCDPGIPCGMYFLLFSSRLCITISWKKWSCNYIGCLEPLLSFIFILQLLRRRFCVIILIQFRKQISRGKPHFFTYIHKN